MTRPELLSRITVRPDVFGGKPNAGRGVKGEVTDRFVICVAFRVQVEVDRPDRSRSVPKRL